jgi:hypothetical protein
MVGRGARAERVQADVVGREDVVASDSARSTWTAASSAVTAASSSGVGSPETTLSRGAVDCSSASGEGPVASGDAAA